MNYNVTLDQKKYSVKLSRSDTTWTAQIGKETFVFSDIDRLGSTLWRLKQNKNEILVEAAIQEDQVGFWLHDQKTTAKVHSAFSERRSATEKGQKLKIKSIMPGFIKKIQVCCGDNVSAGAPLLVLEAMKMENQIESPHSGVVSKIHVQENQSVEGNVLLIEIENT